MNKQREVIYGFRNEIIHAPEVRDRLLDILEEVIARKVEEFTNSEQEFGEWKVRALSDWVNLKFPLGMGEEEILKAAEASHESPSPESVHESLSAPQFAVCRYISDSVRKAYQVKIGYENPEALKEVERFTILSAVDKLWQEHLYEMDSLRYSIGLRSYGQRDPLIEYKAEAYRLFEDLMVNIKDEICHGMFRSATSLMAFENFMRNAPQQTIHTSSSAFGAPPSSTTSNTVPHADNGKPGPPKGSDIVGQAAEMIEKAKPVRAGPKVGRNDLCPCKSGKKYKHCCGK
jgi:preprotein translocase subunit SecA